MVNVFGDSIVRTVWLMYLVNSIVEQYGDNVLGDSIVEQYG